MTASQKAVSLPAQDQSCAAGAIGIVTGWGATRVSEWMVCVQSATLHVNLLPHSVPDCERLYLYIPEFFAGVKRIIV